MLVAATCPLPDLIFMEGLREELEARVSSSVGDGENPVWLC